MTFRARHIQYSNIDQFNFSYTEASILLVFTHFLSYLKMYRGPEEHGGKKMVEKKVFILINVLVGQFVKATTTLEHAQQ